MLAVRPDRFERQLEHVLERGYVATTFTEAVADPRHLERSRSRSTMPIGRSMSSAFPSSNGSASGRPCSHRPSRSVAIQPMAWPGIDACPSRPSTGARLFGASWGAARRARRGRVGRSGRTRGTHPRAPRARRPRRSRPSCAAPESRSRTDSADRARRSRIRTGAVDARVTAAAKAAGYRTGSRAGQPLRPAAEPARLVPGRRPAGGDHGGLSPPHHATVPALSWARPCGEPQAAGFPAFGPCNGALGAAAEHGRTEPQPAPASARS